MADTPITPTPIGSWPTAPQRTDAPATFVTRADAWVAATPTRSAEMNALATNVNYNANSAFDSAVEVSANTIAAAGSAATAAAIANYAGAWSSLSGAKTVPLSVDHEGAFWILLENVADVTAEEPGTSAKWAKAYGNGIIYDRASNVTLVAADNGKIINVTSGSFSQAFDAAANLGEGWAVTIRNNGSGTITLDPSGSETIDGSSTLTLYPGDISFVSCTGSALVTFTQRQPAMSLLASATASNSASISFAGLSDAYTEYEVHVLNAIPVTDGADFCIRTSTNGGSSYDSGGSDYSYSYTANGASSVASGGASYGLLANSVGNDTNENGVCGTIKVFRPSVAQYCNIGCVSSHVLASGTLASTQAMARRLAVADVDAVQLIFSSGNIQSGEFRLYGIRGR